ncbi:hypothetical protein B566_EDAN002734 [Ephemera danica]|nr:hypothetical protein B566_EDAN002734 [Ephemera danica]
MAPTGRDQVLLVWSAVLLLVLVTGAHARDASKAETTDLVQAWAEAARRWFVASVATAEAGGSTRDPENVALAFGLTSAEVAREVSRLSRASIRVYAAVAAGEGETLTATLPDGPMTRAGSHHGVLLLDPFPMARFGHPVLMFFVDLGISERRCNSLGGKRLESGECLQLARKNRCPNLLAAERPGSSSRVSRHRGHLHGRCAVTFLPLVRATGLTSTGFKQQQQQQRLICRDDVPGFISSCPALRDLNTTSQVECDPLRLNTHRCDTTHAAVRTRCRLFQKCDHAVLLSGGWNRELSDEQSLINIVDFYDMLRRNGFHEDNIKLFFANGLAKDEERPAMFPAVMKLSLRYHLRAICESAHCADSLVADETEVYTIRELLRDVSGCQAKRVLLVADQSYSGELARAVHSHQTAPASGLDNVMVFASGSGAQPAWQGDFSAHWSRAPHHRACLQEVYESSLSDVVRSSPTLLDTASGEATRFTLTGAPCGAHARTLSEHERRTLYEGCQNVPTRVWLVGNNEAKRRRR